MKNNIKNRLIGLLIVGFVSLNSNLEVSISIVNPISDAGAENMRSVETGVTNNLFTPLTPRDITPKSTSPALKTSKTESSASNRPASRLVTYDDMVGVVDIGVSSVSEFEGLAVSPDGRYIAFQTLRQDLVKNEIDVRWIALEVESQHRVVDFGPAGQPIPDLSVAQPVGTIRTERPSWVDSERLVYRARFNNVTQVWISSRDGKLREQLTHASTDVVSLGVSADRSHLIYSTNMPRQVESDGDYPEIDRGYLYDDRFSPFVSLRPILANDSSKKEFWVLNLADKSVRRASEAEAVEFQRSDAAAHGLADLPWFRESSNGKSSVWLQVADSPFAKELPARLVGKSSGGQRNPCESERCKAHFKGLWLSDDGETAYFLRWEGEHDYGSVGLYSWRIGTDSVSQILSTDDLLQSCTKVRHTLICQQESATKPGHIVSVDLFNGQREVLFDPNPEFKKMKFGRVEALSWRDADGVEGFGHLVKPPAFQDGGKCPLVVVQYRSRGFLRGGVGDEFPIHVLAAKGLCVLSFHSPDDWELFARSKTLEESVLESWRRQRDRHRTLSVLKAGIGLLVSKGIVDPTRAGISGLSDGANTATFALIHEPRLFSVAAVAWTYWNPILYDLAGPRLLSQLRWFDLENPRSKNGAAQWGQLSVAINASRIEAPLLIQVSDSELLLETQTATELRRFQKPFEMHVFPGEYHIKSQPRHKLSVYKRGVQWFLFWLADREEPDPVDSKQYQRWRQLKLIQQVSSQ